MTSLEIQKLLDEKNGRIDELQINLKRKDYIGVKIAMGRATKTEYRAEIDQCTAWAEEINTLNTEVESLKIQLEQAKAEEDATNENV